MRTPPFDKIFEEANTWINQVAGKLGTEDRQVAYHALRGVLFALRDRMPKGELFDMSAQMPTVIRGILFEGYDPEPTPHKFDRAEFVQHVAEELDVSPDGDAEAAIEAVFGVMKDHLSEGQMSHIQDVLPKQFNDFFAAAR